MKIKSVKTLKDYELLIVALRKARKENDFQYEDYSFCMGYHWWLVIDCGDLAGFAGLNTKEKIAELSIAVVFPKYRGRHFHRKLIKKRIKKAKEEGFSTVWAWTLNTNLVSIGNLKAMGFKKSKGGKGWRNDARKDLIYWEKTI